MKKALVPGLAALVWVVAACNPLTGTNKSNFVELEYDFSPEGSSWGTEDSLRRELEIDRASLPEDFQVPLPAGTQIVADAPRIPQMAGLFSGDRVYVFATLQICVDQTLGLDFARAHDAIETFHKAVFGDQATWRPSFDLRAVGPQQFNDPTCTLLMRRGSWEEYPFSRIREIEQSGAKGRVYAAFFRFDDVTRPVVVVRPDATLEFTLEDSPYLIGEGENGGPRLDARTLLLHELGHFFGFSHLEKEHTHFQHPEATLMGLKHDYRNDRNIDYRFHGAEGLWRFVDQYQATFYRRLAFRAGLSECRPPSDWRERALENSAFDRAFTSYRARLLDLHPKVKSELTLRRVLEGVASHMWELGPETCARFMPVFSGDMPELMEFSHTRPCTAGTCENRTSLSVQLGVWESSGEGTSRTGYSMGVWAIDVDHDQSESQFFEYLCIQTGDTLFVNFEPISDRKLKLPNTVDLPQLDSTVGEQRLQVGSTGLKLHAWLHDFEDDIRLPRMHFKSHAGSWYSWLEVTSSQYGGIVDAEFSLISKTGKAHRAPRVKVEIRDHVAGCQ